MCTRPCRAPSQSWELLSPGPSPSNHHWISGTGRPTASQCSSTLPPARPSCDSGGRTKPAKGRGREREVPTAEQEERAAPAEGRAGGHACPARTEPLRSQDGRWALRPRAAVGTVRAQGHHRLPYLNTTEDPGHRQGGQGRAGPPVHPPRVLKLQARVQSAAPWGQGTCLLGPPGGRGTSPGGLQQKDPQLQTPQPWTELSQAGSEAGGASEHPGRPPVPGEAVLAWPQLSQPRCPKWGTGCPSTGPHRLVLPKGQTRLQTRAAGCQGDTGGPAPWGEAPGRPSPHHIQPQGQLHSAHVICSPGSSHLH